MVDNGCANCHSERLTDADRQEINDFMRFLALVGGGPSQISLEEIRNHPRGEVWLGYVLGKNPAPPEMWEGDDS